MNLYQLAERDSALMLENDSYGFSMPITVVDKAGIEYADVKCFGADIAFLIDPNTGAAIKGRTCDINVRMSTLIDKGISDIATGWQVKFSNVNGDEWTALVKTPYHDRTLGICRITLEGVKNAS